MTHNEPIDPVAKDAQMRALGFDDRHAVAMNALLPETEDCNRAIRFVLDYLPAERTDRLFGPQCARMAIEMTMQLQEARPDAALPTILLAAHGLVLAALSCFPEPNADGRAIFRRILQ